MNPKPVNNKCNICKSKDFEKVKMKDKSLNVIQCKKCGNVKDLSWTDEDQKHILFHATGKEPKDKQGITD